jgi:hypothetical protein
VYSHVLLFGWPGQSVREVCALTCLSHRAHRVSARARLALLWTLAAVSGSHDEMDMRVVHWRRGSRNSALSSRSGKKLEFGPVLGGRSRRLVVGGVCRDATALDSVTGSGSGFWAPNRFRDQLERGGWGVKMPCHGLRRRMFQQIAPTHSGSAVQSCGGGPGLGGPGRHAVGNRELCKTTSGAVVAQRCPIVGRFVSAAILIGSPAPSRFNAPSR